MHGQPMYWMESRPRRDGTALFFEIYFCAEKVHRQPLEPTHATS
jgi:hypothetical protein